MRYGAIEAGGTKMVCAVGDENGTLYDRVVVPTGTPEDTLPRMAEYFRGKEIGALGIGCFGPVDLDRASATYGQILKTPKPGWAHCDIAGYFARELSVPVGFDTDVNGAVLGEVAYGAAQGCGSAIYITVGTGVGVGVYAMAPLHGLLHPEAGHLLLRRHPKDSYRGKCPFHADCMEGLASGPAIEERWGERAENLKDRTEVWELEAYYIAQAVADYVLAYSPEKVVVGGGVMHQSQLFPMVRTEVKRQLGGYLAHPVFDTDLSDYIVPPALGDDAGIVGALCLAGLAVRRED